jgi:hypothetical protein
VFSQSGWNLASIRHSVVGDPERQRDGKPRAEPHDLHVRDRAQLLEQPAEPSSENTSGSPPVSSTSRISGVARIQSSAASSSRFFIAHFRLADHPLAQQNRQ